MARSLRIEYAGGGYHVKTVAIFGRICLLAGELGRRSRGRWAKRRGGTGGGFMRV